MMTVLVSSRTVHTSKGMSALYLGCAFNAHPIRVDLVRTIHTFLRMRMQCASDESISRGGFDVDPLANCGARRIVM